LRTGKSVIVCRKEDAAFMLAQASAPTASAAPVYEKSAVIKKSIKNLVVDNAEALVLESLKGRKGIHVVYSGLNDEIRSRFGVDPTEVTGTMIAKGLINGRGAKGGFWITSK